MLAVSAMSVAETGTNRPQGTAPWGMLLEKE